MRIAKPIVMRASKEIILSIFRNNVWRSFPYHFMNDLMTLPLSNGRSPLPANAVSGMGED